MDGVIVIRKEKDFTSHDVVAKLRLDSSYEEDRTYRNSGSGRGRRTTGGFGKSNPPGGYDHQTKRKHTKQ